MIEESLLKTNFTGKDGFTWWIGRVAHPRTWKNIDTVMSQSGGKGHRVKVRIIGYHPWTDELPEEDLPWAEVLDTPNVGSGQLSRGETMNLVGGETAVGFFLDGDDAQQPVIFGLLHRSGGTLDSIREEESISNPSNGFEVFTADDSVRPPTTLAATEPALVKKGKQGQVKQSKKKKRQQPTVESFAKGSTAGGSAAENTLESKATKTLISGTTCTDNYIGRLTQVLQDFIGITNALEKTIDVYVDPILNEVVDMTYQVKKFANKTASIIKMVLNNIRDSLFGKLNKLFSEFLGKLNTIDPNSFVTTPLAQKGFMKILALLFCIFEALIGELLKFLQDMFETMIGRIVNGTFCAAEQFVQGILAKVMDALENAMKPILKGLDWLMGGIGAVKDILSTVSSLANKIYNFIGCDGLKCTKPSSWISSINGSLEEKRDDWASQVRGINVFRTANQELTKFGQNVDGSTKDIFSSGEYKKKNYKGSNLDSILRDVDKLTAGKYRKKINKGLDSIEAAFATSSLFGDENSTFDACNDKINNPVDQDDLMQMPVGYKFNFCIPPKVKILGSGSGAKLRAIVGNNSEIFSIEVVSGGSGYLKKETSIAIVDKSGHGSGAQAIPVIKKGVIKHVVLTSVGSGYCPNTPDSPVDDTEVPFNDPIPSSCNIDSDCPEGQICIDGLCQPDPDKEPTTCSVDADCPEGEICINGLCQPDPNINTGIGTDVVGIVTFVHPIAPGIGYDPDDTIIIGDDICESCTVGVTTNGSVIDVDLGGFNAKFNIRPSIRIVSDTGSGANLIAVMGYSRQFTSDRDGSNRRRLVGITSVIDCIGD